MHNTRASSEIDIESKIREAEVYRSMGLPTEALAIYEWILSDTPQLDSHTQETIEKEIELVKSEIEDLEQEKGKQLTSGEISIFRERLSTEEDVSAILDRAAAFRELGLFEDAATEYEKLFKLHYPLDKVTPRLLKCLLKIYLASRVPEQIDKIVDKTDLKAQEKARIKYMAGLEMEKMGHHELALGLCESARDLDPRNAEINAKIDSLLARSSYKSRYDYLLRKKLVTTDKLQQALAMSKSAIKSVEYFLIEHFKINKEEVGKSLSYFYGCPFKSYDPELAKPVELLRSLRKPFLMQHLWVPLDWDKKGVNVLIDDPKDLTKTDPINALVKSKKVNFFVGIREDIQAFIERFFANNISDESASEDEVRENLDLIPDIFFEQEEETEDQSEEYDESSGKVVRLVDQILIAAYRKNSSDIHIEPSPINKTTAVRFRIDGVCQEYVNLPNSLAKGIISRLKIMSSLDIAERRLPQDGKIKFKRKGIHPFELRLATLPTAGNFEDAVLRILSRAGAMELGGMELSDRNFKVMKEIISKPYGLVLVVGPTGSGKTTTLHSALGHINKPGIKIWTAEDPVEITQPGLRQVEAKPKIGLDFARIMRAFLRADPDVIMIGEMRDEETASIAIEASLTGHLVFSTLHTNSAPETVTRLLDMGLNPLNFSDAFLGVLAQRLVRRLCKKCVQEYHPSKEEFDEIVSEYGEEHFGVIGIKYSPDLTLYRPGSCEICSDTGYKGRLAIHELMEGTAEIKKMIKKQASTEMIIEQAIKEGMTTLKQDGIAKVFQGLTDISEVRRVCIT